MRKIIGHLLVVATFAQAGSSVQAQTYTNPQNGHAYTLTSSESWQSARVDAQLLGGYLVSVNDQTEQDWLNATFPNDTYWIGLTDEITEGTWVWESGEPLTFTSWQAGEPNNYHSSPQGEDYATTNNQGWVDWPSPLYNSTPVNFMGIVETPEPATGAMIAFGIGAVVMRRSRRASCRM